MQAYPTSQEHLFDELQRLELLLRMQIEQFRSEAGAVNMSEFRGLFLSEEEIDAVFEIPKQDALANQSTKNANIAQLQKATKKLEHQIADKVNGATKAGIHLSLLNVKQRFYLTPFDTDVLLLCLAPELDLKYEKLYAYLQNDVTAKRPTIDLALHLHCHTFTERIRARTRFNNDAPLFKHHLIAFTGNEPDVSKSFLSQTLTIDEGLVQFLLGLPGMDNNISSFTRLVWPSVGIEEVLLAPEKMSGLRDHFLSSLASLQEEDHRRGKVFNLFGPPGAGKKFTAEALCHSAHMPLLIVNFPHLPVGRKPVEILLKRLIREARLHGAAVYLDRINRLQGDGEKIGQIREILVELINSFPGIIFLGNDKSWKTDSPLEAETIVNVYLPEPEFRSRQKLWQKLLDVQARGSLSTAEIAEIANKFQFTAGKIYQAVAEAKHYAEMRQPNGQLSSEDVYRACRLQSTTNLGSLAQKINSPFIWHDIVLPEDTLRHLQEICLHVKHRQQVFSDWKFNQKISLGRGASALFAGLPGTGKTMAAGIIANELGLDLYKIDLSTVVSKYIGETEKNLSRIFEEAEMSNAILFFDEADALFGKRSEVKDAHDRYANIEINYLLQKMEEYEGMVILATNFQKNIDEAFTRRLRFIVDFPFPDRSYRARIWRNIFPGEMPLSKEIAYDFLARKFEISGGDIKNIALSAAFLASENSGIVSMKHIVRAANREFQKMGKMVVAADFEEYFDLLQGGSE